MKIKKLIRYSSVKDHFFSYLYSIIIAVPILMPFFFTFISSFKKTSQIYKFPPEFIFKPTLENYEYVLKTANLIKNLANSALIAVTSSLITMTFAILAAYAISRYKMRKISAGILVARIIPSTCFMIPLYFVFSRMGLLDTYTVMIIMHMMFSIPTTVYICTNFIDDLPYEIEEAAFVDGATKQHTFFKIVLPLCSPALITSSTLSFLGSWNNFQLSLIFGQAKTKTLPVALYGFMSSDAVRWGRLLAAAMIIMVPAILLTMVLQKYIISGLSAGSIKG